MNKSLFLLNERKKFKSYLIRNVIIQHNNHKTNTTQKKTATILVFLTKKDFSRAKQNYYKK